MYDQKPVRVRFAPSPTGMLHIGGLRTALFNFLFARHNQGSFLVRIEDTDKERSQDHYTQMIIDTLSWCAMGSDETIVIQSERHSEHLRIAHELISQGKAYYCYCSPDELQKRVGNVTREGVSYVRYDGYCKRFIGLQPGKDIEKPYVIRFAVPESCTQVVVQDIIKGPITFNADTFDDFILLRSDGSPMYNFVVVVDDAFMRISHIIRGEEHLINTPKQILLYQACGYAVPTFGHLPLILGPDGAKMSKRDAAANAYDYKKQGYLPHALCNYLVRLGWAHGDQEIFTLSEMIASFTLEGVSSKGALFDAQKLDWVNGMHMKNSSAQALYDYMSGVLGLPLANNFSSWSMQTIFAAIDLYKKRSVTLQELFNELVQLHHRPQRYELNNLTHEQKKLLESLMTLLVETHFVAEELTQKIKEFCRNQQIGLGDLAPLIRVSLTGKKDAPGIYDLMMVCGKDETIARVHAYAA